MASKNLLEKKIGSVPYLDHTKQGMESVRGMKKNKQSVAFKKKDFCSPYFHVTTLWKKKAQLTS